MKEKYIEERFPRYFTYGQRGSLVDVASVNNDTVATVSQEHADNLINDRDEVIDMLIRLAQKLDEISHEEFAKIWYGDKL